MRMLEVTVQLPGATAETDSITSPFQQQPLVDTTNIRFLKDWGMSFVLNSDRLTGILASR